MNTPDPKDIYYTIRSRERQEIKIKGSSFIATAIPVLSKEHALRELDDIRAEFFDASHNCFAYRLGRDGMEFRASDDGEPSGSAGKPILFMLQKFDVSDILLIVTRYFGGTKLGIGGLARAYTDAADAVLQTCLRIPVYRSVQIRVFCTYEDVSAVKKIIDEVAISSESDYRDAIQFIAHIPLLQADEFCARITSVSSGRAGTVIEEIGL
jgi:uncharacterized YigZ family protein